MSIDYPFGEGPAKLVSTDWLKEHIDDGMTIVDTQPDIHDYIQEHIPSAVYLNQKLFRVPYMGRPGVYVEPSMIESLFSRVGIKKDVPVLVYTGVGPFRGWGDGLEQTMVAYTLIRFGHSEVYLLDGGIDKWKAEGGTVIKDFPHVTPSEFKAEVNSSYYIEYEEFKKIKDDDGVVVLDARPPDVYQGQGPWIKPGHIPGAVNLPWKSLMTDDNPKLLKPLDEVRSLLEKAGASSDKKVICTCGTGREATNEFLLMKCYLGYKDVVLYEGSFTEWTAYPDNPTVTGESPR